MPSAKTHTALNRQWELLLRLPTRPSGLSVAELHRSLCNDGYEVTRRTIERDLESLSSMFPLQCEDHLTPQTWYRLPGVSQRLEGLTLPEAVSMTLVEGAVRPLLPASMLSVLEPRFAHAREKLKSLAEATPGARWPNKVASVRADFNLQSPQINATILEAVQQALINERQLRCVYYAAHSNKSRELTLNPLAIVQRGQITYLIATAATYTDVRQYAMHRFREVQPLETACTGAADFDLQGYLDTDALQFGTLQKIRLKAWVNPHQARLISETPLSADMQLREVEDGFEVEATVSDTWQLHWWILSQGDALVVLEPLELREKIAEQLHKAAAAYGPR